MRVIASVQPKRGSSRGLVHYIAHSKIDTAREPAEGREIFNAYSDHLTVQSANNFLKPDCGKGRPSNNDLHHLVLSFRHEDFQRLGTTDDERIKGIKSVTRAAVSRLENWIHTDRLAWAGAVHLNTENPHVHIAIQKQYQRTDLTERMLTKIPRGALPHFELTDGEKRLVDGFLIEAAKLELDGLIAIRNHSRVYKRSPTTARTKSPSDREASTTRIEAESRERETLRRGILAEYRLKFKKDRISFLLERRDEFRYPLTDKTSGTKRKVSLRDLASRPRSSDGGETEAQLRQLRAISNSILAREEFEFFNLKADTAQVRKEARKLRNRYKKRGIKIPLPAFSKRELDELQSQCLDAVKPREFLFLENIRTGLEASNEISPRDNKDIESLAGRKMLFEMRTRLYQKQLSDFKDNSYYRKVLVGKKRLSLAMLEREPDQKVTRGSTVLQSLRRVIENVTGRKQQPFWKSSALGASESVNRALNQECMRLENSHRAEQKLAAILGKVLDRDDHETTTRPSLSADQLLELEAISRKLGLGNEFRANWKLQKSKIGAIASRDTNTKRHDEHGNTFRLIAGRVLARDTLCQIGLSQAKDDFEFFRKSKQYHKFAINDRTTSSNSYLSLNDVDFPRNQSVLDQALNLVLESSAHRTLRRELGGRVQNREAVLRERLSAAKQLALAASTEASGLNIATIDPHTVRPLFTSSEVTEIEKRIERTANVKEAAKLRSVLERSSTISAASFTELKRETTPTPRRQHSARETSANVADHASELALPKSRTRSEPEHGVQR